MTRARNSANLASDGNLFVNISDDRTGIGSLSPTHKLHVAGTSFFDDDVLFRGANTGRNCTWDKSTRSLVFDGNNSVNGNYARARFSASGTYAMDVYNNLNNFVEVAPNVALFVKTCDLQVSGSGSRGGTTYDNAILRARTGIVELGHEIGNGGASGYKLATAAYGVNVTGTTDTDGLIVSGVATVTTMNVTGVLTYDDVTSVDSVGIVTARQGVHIDDSIVHISDPNTKIRFPAADTFSVETGGTQGVRLTSAQKLLVGDHTSSRSVGLSEAVIQTEGTSASENGISIYAFNNSAHAGHFTFGKSRNNGSVADNDYLGHIMWAAHDGTDVDNFGARITGRIDGTVGSNVTPGSLEFYTTSAGANSVNNTPRLIIGADGAATFSGNVTVSGNLSVTGTTTQNNTVSTTEKTITLASGAANNAAVDGAGIVVDAGSDTDKTLKWLDSTDRWTFTGGDVSANAFYGDGANLTNTGSTLSQPSTGTQRIVTTSLTSGTMTSSGTGSELAFDYANNHLEFSDSTKATFGTDNDLLIYHNGSHGVIENTTGNLHIKDDSIKIQSSSAASMIIATGGGAVELYHNATKRLETTSSGVEIPQALFVGEKIDMPDHTSGTNGMILLGTGDDLFMYHDGNNSHLRNNTGTFNIRATNFRLTDAAIQHVYLKTNDGGNDEVGLYYDNSVKLETKSGGVLVTGDVDSTTGIFEHTTNFTSQLKFTGSNETQLIHASNGQVKLSFIGTGNAARGSIDAQSGFIRIKTAADETGIICRDNSSTDLHFDGTKMFETLSNGARVVNQFFVSEGTINLEKAGVHHHRILSNDTGNDLGFQQSSDTGANTNFTTYLRINDGGNISLPVDNQKLRLGASGDLQLFHNGSNSGIQNYQGALYILNTATNSSDLHLQGKSSIQLHCPADGNVRLKVDNNGRTKLFPAGENGGAQGTPLYLQVQTDLTNVNSPSGGSDCTGLFRIEDKGSTNGRYHGIDLRNRNSGDVRILNKDINVSNGAALVFAVDDNGQFDGSGTIRQYLQINGQGQTSAITLSGAYHVVASARDGLTSANAAASAWEIKKTLGPAARDGYYYLKNPYDGTTSQWWCDMHTDGGGWVLIAHTGDGQMSSQSTSGAHWWDRQSKGGFDPVGAGYYQGGGYWRQSNGAWGENTCGQLMWDVRTHYSEFDNRSNDKVVFNWGTDQNLPSGNSGYSNIPNSSNRRFNEWCYSVENAPGFNPMNYDNNVRSNKINGAEHFTEHMVMTFCFRNTGGSADNGSNGPYWMIGAHHDGLHQHYEESLSGGDGVYGDGGYQVVSNEDTGWGGGGTNNGYRRIARHSDNGTVNIWLR